MEDTGEDLVTIYKVQSISSAHRLNLPYESKCNRLHGHNYRFEMYVTGSVDPYGMVIDFHDLKREVNKLDHINLNDMFDFPTTAENLAIYMAKQIGKLAPDRVVNVKVKVWETETAYAEHKIDLS